MNLRDRLIELEACEAALEWVEDRPLDQAWLECPRGDWLLWFLAATTTQKRFVATALAAAAQRVLRYVPKEDPVPGKTVELVGAWSQEQPITRAQLCEAANLIGVYISTKHDRNSAFYAANAVFHAAAYAASTTVYAIAVANDVAVYVLHAIAAGDRVNYEVARLELADLVRATIPLESVQAAMVGS